MPIFNIESSKVGLLNKGEDNLFYEDDDCSSSEDEFLEIPLNDRFFYKH